MCSVSGFAINVDSLPKVSIYGLNNSLILTVMTNICLQLLYCLYIANDTDNDNDDDDDEGDDEDEDDNANDENKHNHNHNHKHMHIQNQNQNYNHNQNYCMSFQK